LARGQADVGAVGARPAHDRQAAGAGVAAGARAGVADERVADGALVDVLGELARADELAALAVREDEHRPTLAGDELARLRRGAGGEPVQRVSVAQVGGEGIDARLRQRAGPAGVLGVAAPARCRRRASMPSVPTCATRTR